MDLFNTLSISQQQQQQPFLPTTTYNPFLARGHLNAPSNIFNVDSLGPSLYFLLMIYLVLSLLSISRLRSILKFIPLWSALKLLYTTIAIHLCTRTLGLILLVLLTIFKYQEFSYQFQTILFTFPEYCFITLYLIIIVQWITSLLNAYGNGQLSIVNGSKCRRWTRILFFTACLAVLISIITFYILLWFQPDSTSDQIERSCTGLNLGIVGFAIIVAFMMYCCVLSRHTNTSYVSLQIVKKLSYTVVVASIGRVFRAVILLLSSFLVWQDSMEQSTLSMSIISILTLCELFPLFLLLDWRLVFLLLGGEEIVETKVGEPGTALFLPFDFSSTTSNIQSGNNSNQQYGVSATTSTAKTTNDDSSSNNNQITIMDTTTSYVPQTDISTTLNSQSPSSNPFSEESIQKSIPSTNPNHVTNNNTNNTSNQLFYQPSLHYEQSDLADPLLLPQFNIETPTGPCFDPMTLSLPRALFLPNNESLHKPPAELLALLNRDKNKKKMNTNSTTANIRPTNTNYTTNNNNDDDNNNNNSNNNHNNDDDNNNSNNNNDNNNNNNNNNYNNDSDNNNSNNNNDNNNNNNNYYNNDSDNNNNKNTISITSMQDEDAYEFNNNDNYSTHHNDDHNFENHHNKDNSIDLGTKSLNDHASIHSTTIHDGVATNINPPTLTTHNNNNGDNNNNNNNIHTINDDEIDDQQSSKESILQANKLWNGIYYGHYHDKLTTLSQIIYTNPLWITCSGYTQSQTRIAVKRFVLPGLDETALRELGIEAYTRGQLSLQCPNILPVLGFNVSGSSLCIISEYKQRRSLFDFLRSTEKNIAPTGILKLALGIATGMECLHSNEYVHGHFNSRNVILDESLQVYIADVGDRSVRIFAQAMYGSHVRTQWCAPEVLAGATPTKASDVYSFGVICWELCYRLIPFQYYSLDELCYNVGKNGDKLLLPSLDEIAKAQMLAKNAGKSLRHVIPYDFIKLVARCFYKVDLRPSFTDITEALQSIYQQMVNHKD